MVASMVWGQQRWQQRVKIHCDNEAVEEVIKAGYSKEPYLMHLLHCIFFVTAFYEIIMLPTHIPGTENSAADAVSRNNISTPRFPPPPNDPDASLYKCTSQPCLGTFSSIATPIQDSKNWCHHSRSDLKFALNLTQGCLLVPHFNSSNILRRKVLPGRTILQFADQRL